MFPSTLPKVGFGGHPSFVHLSLVAPGLVAVAVADDLGVLAKGSCSCAVHGTVFVVFRDVNNFESVYIFMSSSKCYFLP